MTDENYIDENDLYCFKAFKRLNYGNIEIEFSTRCDRCYTFGECWKKIDSLSSMKIVVGVKDGNSSVYFSIGIFRRIAEADMGVYRDPYIIMNGECRLCNDCVTCICDCHDVYHTEDILNDVYYDDSLPYKVSTYQIEDFILDYLNTAKIDINLLINYLRCFAISTDFFNEALFKHKNDKIMMQRFMSLINNSATKSARKR